MADALEHRVGVIVSNDAQPQKRARMQLCTPAAVGQYVATLLARGHAPLWDLLDKLATDADSAQRDCTVSGIVCKHRTLKEACSSCALLFSAVSEQQAHAR